MRGYLLFKNKVVDTSLQTWYAGDMFNFKPLLRPRNLALFSFAPLLSLCTPDRCAPAPATVEKEAPAVCENVLSWHGRSPVNVPHASAPAQGLIDQGNAVNIGWDGSEYIAGHYSSHGSVFRSGPSLSGGDEINYDCQTYVVYDRASAHAGDDLGDFIREGLAIQYSGCGGVCVVYAR